MRIQELNNVMNEAKLRRKANETGEQHSLSSPRTSKMMRLLNDRRVQGAAAAVVVGVASWLMTRRNRDFTWS